MGLEGIVAKRKTSSYRQGKRSKDWIKCKVLSTIDCVICGYIIKEHSMSSLIIGMYEGDKLVYKGHVSLGVSISALLKYGIRKIDYSPFGYVQRGNTDAEWVEPNLVCIYDSMPHEGKLFGNQYLKVLDAISYHLNVK